MREVVITGLGVVLPACDDPDVLWSHLRDGQSQLRFEDDPSMPGRRLPMGRIRDFAPGKYLSEFPPRFYECYEREVQLYLSSLLLARDHAKLALDRVAPERVGLFDGCSRPGFLGWHDRIRRETRDPLEKIYSRRDLLSGTPGLAAGIAASLLEIRGSVYTFNGTCSSGAIAIGHAYREVRDGELDVAFATGHESVLSAPLYAIYREGNLLSHENEDPRRAVRPYSECLGNAFGEGAVTLTLESRDHARARGATCLAEVAGYKYGNNGFHPTTPDLAGGRPAQLVRDVLERSGTPLADVAFVVGHGNAVQLSDASEENYMLLLFGDRAREVPLVSNKPIYGHLLGASSALNAASTALMLQHQFVAPTLNVDPAHAHADFDHMAEVGAARECKAGIAISFGLGGNNTALLLKRAVAESHG